MFEFDVKNVTEEGRGGEEGRGPARVWGSDIQLKVGESRQYKQKCRIVYWLQGHTTDNTTGTCAPTSVFL